LKPSTMSRRRFLVGGSTALAGATLLSACGNGGSGTGESAQSGGSTTLSVGILPITPVAPLYLGIEKGFFQEENLEVETQQTSAGAANLTSVVSGDVQIGFSDVVSQIIAAAEGLPIQVLTNANGGGNEPSNTYSAVVVAEDSPIETPEDLAGKTIAVNALNNIGDVTIRGSLESKGVDISNLEFIEVPYPAMLGALEDGRVDAIWVVEPFLSQAKSAGAKPILYNYVEGIPSGTLAAYFTSESFIADNPEAKDRFVNAMNRSLDYAEANPGEVRDIIPEFSEIPPEVAENIILPVYGSELRTESIERIADLLVRYDVIESKPDLEELGYESTSEG